MSTWMIPFALYHGTSSHYLNAFRVGRAPAGWPYQDAVIKLLQDAWQVLRNHGIETEWFEERVLAQQCGNANWQHGELYVTPSGGKRLPDRRTICAIAPYASSGWGST